ncbi:MAG TPA: type II secretion system minor pseudopilin GspK, partial [Nitrospiria bacterium]
MNKRPRRFCNERGVALLLTLVILALLTAVVVEFDYGARINLITAGNFRDEVRATYLAKTGLAAARAVLRDDTVNHKDHDGLGELWAQPLESFPLGEGFVSGRITDESGKLNINLLAGSDASKWRPIWMNLFKTLQIDPEAQETILDSIKDWIDEGSEPETYGAEDDYYERQKPAYRAKNAPMDTIGELQYVKGVTREIYDKLTTKCEGPCFTVANTTAINV